MKFHGLVFLAVAGLASIAEAQSGSQPDQNFLPPAPRRYEVPPEPTLLPPAPSATEPNVAASMEAELRQFRNELREFQTVREDVSRNTKAADTATDNLSTNQRQELMDLLAKLAKQSLNRKKEVTTQRVVPIPSDPVISQNHSRAASAPAATTEAVSPADSVTIADPFALGKVLFRSGDFAGAEKAFRKTIVTPENEMMVKYLLATCLRRQSRWKPAMDAYKAVADSNQDPVLRDLAKWQLDNIRWHQQSESQLDLLRQQRDKRTEASTSQSTDTPAPK